MEDHYPLDIGVRNVAVRLNETNTMNSEMNGDNVCSHSVFCSSTADQSKETSCLNDECSEKINTTASDITEEFRDKLHVSESSDSCELLNGCNKLLHDDIKRVDFAVNGLMKCNSVERINACIDQLNHRTCIEKSVEPVRTESAVKNVTVETVNSDDDCLSSSTVVNPDNVHMHTSEAIWEVEHGESYHNMLHSCCGSDANIRYLGYDSESQMPDIMRLIQKDLSEPYSIYTYRYFIHNWPKLCFLAQDDDKCVGAIVCKLDVHKKHSRRGYIAMLAVDENYRKKKIGSNLVLKAINAMVQDCADEVVLETEITNKPALRLYENLGFVRDKRLFRYYLNGVDALRLKLWLR